MMSPDEKIVGSKIFMDLEEKGCKESYVKAMELLMMDNMFDLLKILVENTNKIIEHLEAKNQTFKSEEPEK